MAYVSHTTLASHGYGVRLLILDALEGERAQLDGSSSRESRRMRGDVEGGDGAGRRARLEAPLVHQLIAATVLAHCLCQTMKDSGYVRAHAHVLHVRRLRNYITNHTHLPML